MKLPNEVRVGPHMIEVLEIDSQEALSNGIHGDFNPVLLRVRVDNTLPESKVKEILLHELCHAIFSVYKLTDDDAEEEIVSVFGPALLGLLRDNPKLVSLITGKH